MGISFDDVSSACDNEMGSRFILVTRKSNVIKTTFTDNYSDGFSTCATIYAFSVSFLLSDFF